VIATVSPRLRDQCHPGFPLGIATVPASLLWKLCDDSLTALTRCSRREISVSHPEAALEHLRDRNAVSMGSLTSTAMVTCGGTSEDAHSALTSGVDTRSEAEGKINGRPLI
jgi:hypothetical protein